MFIESSDFSITTWVSRENYLKLNNNLILPGRAGELGYLNADAVVLTFKEVAKAGFEAAELFEGVKALLFSETMPAEEPKKEDEQ